MFPLTQTCTIQKATTTTARSGQVIDTWTNNATGVQCLFDPKKGQRVHATTVEFQQKDFLYLNPNANVDEGDRITNILGSDGVLVDPGPWQVGFIRRVPTLSGVAHHLTCHLLGTG